MEKYSHGERLLGWKEELVGVCMPQEDLKRRLAIAQNSGSSWILLAQRAWGFSHSLERRAWLCITEKPN